MCKGTQDMLHLILPSCLIVEGPTSEEKLWASFPGYSPFLSRLGIKAPWEHYTLYATTGNRPEILAIRP